MEAQHTLSDRRAPSSGKTYLTYFFTNEQKADTNLFSQLLQYGNNASVESKL